MPRKPRGRASAELDSDLPSDHVSVGAEPPIQQPQLGVVGWLRFLWRQLTSMRTALVLLLLLALAAVPGSLVPQRSSDPNGVVQYQQQNPDSFKVLDALGVFSTFTSPWFSAIYLLLFVSLVGCIIPRIKHHLDALRAAPPRTPMRLERLGGFQAIELSGSVAATTDVAHAVLKKAGYRVVRYADGKGDSASAERGYLRETGNLVFHTALVGILVAVGVGGGFSYTGQRVLVQDTTFTNTLGGYDSFNPGRFFDESQLQPYALRLDDFQPSYAFDPATGNWDPTDYNASLSYRTPGNDWQPITLKVNSPLELGGTQVYLLGNGFAPTLTIRDPSGKVVQSDPIPYLPQNANLFSQGVIKVPDGLAQQLGMIALFYPTPVDTASGALASLAPDPNDPVVSLNVYQGDLGLNTGVSVNAYSLDTDGMTQLAGPGTNTPGLVLHLGDKVDLPNGLGTVEFSGLTRFVTLDIHHDPTMGWVLGFAIAVLGGLLLSLFVPRRRVWIKVTPAARGKVRVEYAGLARGEDAGLDAAVADLARAHQEALGMPADAAPAPTTTPEPRIEP